MQDKLPSFSSYKDVLNKAIHDFETHQSDGHIYSLINCFLSLNSLPEWIESEIQDNNLKELAKAKIKVMKHSDNDYDYKSNVSTNDIDLKLRLVRSCSNHIKHAKDKNFAPIVIRDGAVFPARFPIHFQHLAFQDPTITTEITITPRSVAEEVIDFWKEQLEMV